jgi:predicted glycosyltransferase
MAAADLVVSMAGSNTLAESLALQKRVVTIPRAEMLVEQRIRASLFDRLGLVHMLPPEQLSPRSLADAIVRALDVPGPPRALWFL